MSTAAVLRAGNLLCAGLLRAGDMLPAGLLQREKVSAEKVPTGDVLPRALCAVLLPVRPRDVVERSRDGL
jgi:hypothetical protein